MKLSVSAWSLEKKLFNNEITLFDFIEFCKENNVEHVELLDCFWKEESDIVKVNDLLRKYGMKVSAYSIGNDFVQSDVLERKKQIDSVKKGVDIACKLNTDKLRIFSGDVKVGITYDYAKEWIVECLKECVTYAEKKGITLVLENHGMLAGKSNQIKNIIEEVDSKYLMSNADVGNFLLVNENPYDAIKALNGYIGFIHLKDLKAVDKNETGYNSLNGLKYQGTVLGKGDVPMKEIVNYLSDNGYNGFLSIEYEGNGDPIKDTAESIKFAKSLLT